MSESKEILYPVVKKGKETKSKEDYDIVINTIKEHIIDLCVLLPTLHLEHEPNNEMFRKVFTDGKKYVCVYSKSGYKESPSIENESVLIIPIRVVIKQLINTDYDGIIIDCDGTNGLILPQEVMKELVKGI